MSGVILAESQSQLLLVTPLAIDVIRIILEYIKFLKFQFQFLYSFACTSTRLSPTDIAIWHDDSFIVSGNNIVIYDKKGKILRRIGSDGSSSRTSDGIFLDVQGVEVFVSDSQRQQVQVYDANTGTCLRTIGKKEGEGGLQGRLRGELTYPTGIVVVDSRLFVAGTHPSGVSVFDARNGEFITLFGGSADELNGPRGLCYDFESECIYVADNLNNRIQIWDKDLAYKGQIGNISHSYTGRRDALPFGITVTSTELFISEHGDNKVSLWALKERTRTGTLRQFNSNDGLRKPSGMRITSRNELVICDSGNGRILVFE